MKALILAGGSGTRLWPLSRETYPKQFLKVNGEKSLLQQTVERVLEFLSPEDIILLTNEQYKSYVLSEVSKISPAIAERVLLEPVGRNTAPAIALGMKYCIEKLNTPLDEVLFVCPSDHIIKPVEKFVEYVKKAEKVAKLNYIVTFGVKPLYPETGYGYLKVKVKKEDGEFYLPVEKFIEKPNIETARKFLSEGGFYWNSGMFVFTIQTMVGELKLHAQELYKFFNLPLEDMLSSFHNIPSISIDYAVMEKSKKVVAIPMDIYWSDVGSWDSLYDALEKDERGNVILGGVLTKDTENSLIMGNDRLIVAIDLKDVIVIDTKDAILIAKRGSTQKVKNIFEKLRKQSRTEVLEHKVKRYPWGECKVLEEGEKYKIKKIVIEPGERLSFDANCENSKLWILLKGSAKAIIGDKAVILHGNEPLYIPSFIPHELENLGELPLEVLEVQNEKVIAQNIPPML